MTRRQRVAVAIAAGVLQFAMGHAEAMPRHRHRHHHHHRPVRVHQDGRPAAWCGWWLGRYVGMLDRRLWLAREWEHVGRPASGPAPGVIGVQRHHVFQVIRVVAPGRVLAISGNDGNAVRTRVRSTSNVIAWRAL